MSTSASEPGIGIASSSHTQLRVSKDVYDARIAEKKGTLLAIEEEIPVELIEAIKNGSCVAFVGAGFSGPCRMPTVRLCFVIIRDMQFYQLIFNSFFFITVAYIITKYY